MMPGDTQLTRTGASSSARLRASDSIAPLAAPTMAEFGRGRMLRNPETSVSDPPGRMSAARAHPPGAPELALHGRAHIVHRNGLERAGLELCRGNDDMIDRTAAAKKFDDAVIAGDIGRDGEGVQPGCDRVQPVDIAGGNDDLGPFPLGEFGGRKTDAG